MDRRSRATKIHRRFELLVAMLAIAGVALVLSSAEPASAADEASTETTIPAPAEALPSDVDAEAVPAIPPAAPIPSTEPTPAPSGEGAPVEGPSEPAPLAAREPSPLRINSAQASPSRIFLGSRRRAAFRFQLSGDRARKLLVKVIKVSTGGVKKRFRLGGVRPGERRRVAWDGKLGGRGGFAEQGEYAFRVFSGGERAGVNRRSGSQRFNFYEHRCPLLGRHSYGDGFGAGRGHQGQDVFAACGTRIAAARGGRVQTKAYHSGAGYYVVIDGRGTGQDYVYMHMERGDRPREGSWVHTGELIGHESDTGDATGCHLHFELWTAPGWYEGGNAKPPTRALQRWDRWS